MFSSFLVRHTTWCIFAALFCALWQQQLAATHALHPIVGVCTLEQKWQNQYQYHALLLSPLLSSPLLSSSLFSSPLLSLGAFLCRFRVPTQTFFCAKCDLQILLILTPIIGLTWRLTCDSLGTHLGREVTKTCIVATLVIKCDFEMFF